MKETLKPTNKLWRLYGSCSISVFIALLIILFLKILSDKKHPTHVAGIACGNGFLSRGKYSGIATEANIIALKVLDDEGRGSSADVLAGLQWVADNKDIYNIHIVNLSVGTPDIGSFDPLVKAVESIWDMGIVVTVAAGNNGPQFSTVTSPGISRKVITVGASDDNMRSVAISGDCLVDFSGRGPTSECIVKPDILAPGTNIVSCLSGEICPKSYEAHKDRVVDKTYLSLSGTSMSTPIVSGAIALLLEKNPLLTPDDVKYSIKHGALNLNRQANQQGWGLIDIEKLVLGDAKYVGKKNI